MEKKKKRSKGAKKNEPTNDEKKYPVGLQKSRNADPGVVWCRKIDCCASHSMPLRERENGVKLKMKMLGKLGAIFRRSILYVYKVLVIYSKNSEK